MTKQRVPYPDLNHLTWTAMGERPPPMWAWIAIALTLTVLTLTLR